MNDVDVVGCSAPVGARLTAVLASALPRGRYRLVNWYARCFPSRFPARLPKALGGAVFECDLRDVIAREAYFFGVYEAQEVAVLKALLQPGHRFVDVGANWGFYTLFGACRVGLAGRVLAMEPEPRMFKILQGNLVRNRFESSRVFAIAAAAGDGAGTMTLEGFDEAAGNFGLSQLVPDGYGPSHSNGLMVEVPTHRLDDLLPEHGFDEVDLLKMDIEGAEALALAGLAQSLATGRIRRLLIEMHVDFFSRFEKSVAEVLVPLQAAGYRGWTWDGSYAAMHRAAYARRIDPATLLQPLNPLALPAWPRFHTLWVAPGVEGPLPNAPGAKPSP